jgi:hypothetical protein
MAKVLKAFCLFCEKKIHAGVSFCPHCAHPTPWASHDERVDFEVAQWQRSRASSVHRPSKAAPLSPSRRRAREAEQPKRVALDPPAPIVVPRKRAAAQAQVSIDPMSQNGHGDALRVSSSSATPIKPTKRVPIRPAPRRARTEPVAPVDPVEPAAGTTPEPATPGPVAPEPATSSDKVVSLTQQRARRRVVKTKPILETPVVDPSEFVIESEPIEQAPRRKVPATKPAATKKAAAKKQPALSTPKPSVAKARPAAAKKQAATARPDRTIDLADAPSPEPVVQPNGSVPVQSLQIDQLVDVLVTMNERLEAIEQRLTSMNGHAPQKVRRFGRRARS